MNVHDPNFECNPPAITPTACGPQPMNCIAPTAAEQIARARRGRPRPSLDDRIRVLESRVAYLTHRFAAAGVPA